jgi:hypothetical protein
LRIFGGGFKNAFINTLFTNTELKTVYNGSGNYKQSLKVVLHDDSENYDMVSKDY